MFVGIGELYLNSFNTQVITWMDNEPDSTLIWKLVPVKVENMLAPSRSSSGMLGLDSLPSCNGNATGQSPTRAQHAGSGHDEFGTVVTEVTTTVIITRKKHRVKDA